MATLVVTSCTSNFCTNIEKSRILFAVEPGVSTYYASYEEAVGALLAALAKGGYKVSVPVYVEESKAGYGRTSLVLHEVAVDGVVPFDALELVLAKRGPAVAHYAALAAADLVVAAEPLGDYLLRDKGIPYLDNGAEVACAHC